MKEKPRLDVLTLYTSFYDLSVSRNLFSKAEIRQFEASGTEKLIDRDKFSTIFANDNDVHIQRT